MAKLPAKDVLNGSKNPKTTTLEMKAALGELRDYLSDLLGSDSSDKTAAREALGVDLSGLNEQITGQISNIRFEDIREKPTTLEAYGINNAVSRVEMNGTDGVLMDLPVGKQVVVTYEGTPSSVCFSVPDDSFEKTIFFTSGTTPAILTISGSYKTVGDLTIEANKSYVICIINKVIVMGECREP